MENQKPENQNQKPKNKMNKTWILVAILVVIAAILLVVSLSAKNTLKNPSTSKEMSEDVAHTSLSFSENVRPGASPDNYEVDIQIDSSDNKVTFAQLEMSYDPASLTQVDIKPGNFIQNPVILQKSVNATDGRIKYWIGISPNQKGVQGKGVIATLSFSKSGSTGAAINFLPKTSVSATGTDQSVLKDMVSGYIDALPSSSSSLPVSTSPVISQ